MTRTTQAQSTTDPAPPTAPNVIREVFDLSTVQHPEPARAIAEFRTGARLLYGLSELKLSTAGSTRASSAQMVTDFIRGDGIFSACRDSTLNGLRTHFTEQVENACRRLVRLLDRGAVLLTSNELELPRTVLFRIVTLELYSMLHLRAEESGRRARLSETDTADILTRRVLPPEFDQTQTTPLGTNVAPKTDRHPYVPPRQLSESECTARWELSLVNRLMSYIGGQICSISEQARLYRDVRTFQLHHPQAGDPLQNIGEVFSSELQEVAQFVRDIQEFDRNATRYSPRQCYGLWHRMELLAGRLGLDEVEPREEILGRELCSPQNFGRLHFHASHFERAYLLSEEFLDRTPHFPKTHGDAITLAEAIEPLIRENRSPEEISQILRQSMVGREDSPQLLRIMVGLRCSGVPVTELMLPPIAATPHLQALLGPDSSFLREPREQKLSRIVAISTACRTHPAFYAQLEEEIQKHRSVPGVDSTGFRLAALELMQLPNLPTALQSPGMLLNHLISATQCGLSIAHILTCHRHMAIPNHRTESCNFISDLCSLHRQGVSGTGILLDHAVGCITREEPSWSIYGFFGEARLALRLLQEGFEEVSLSATHNSGREYDAIAKRGGCTFGIEMKTSSKALISWLKKDDRGQGGERGSKLWYLMDCCRQDSLVPLLIVERGLDTEAAKLLNDEIVFLARHTRYADLTALSRYETPAQIKHHVYGKGTL